MNVNVHAIGGWVALTVSIGGLYGVYSQITKDHQSQIQEVREQAQDRQKRADAYNQRFAYVEMEIEALKSQLPQDKRELLNAIAAAQRNYQAPSQQVLMYDKSMPKSELDVDCVKKGICVTAIAADAPKTERVQQ